ncbi:LCP family protein required for cell wall assembly [Streptacidiphilus sp. MAP12-16]|uniref:LCP family protein n=1 Tax=Streptacidiphilus sp. MAP12-16 TaxID=3156300 RepID=UPI003511E5C9
MSDTRIGGRAAARRGGGSASGAVSDAVGSGGGGRAAARKGRKRKKPLKVIAITTAAIVAVTAAAGTYIYVQLNGNIKSVPLFGGTSGSAGVEKADAFGRTPINMLVIGSDGRNNPTDCKIGGDCGPGANADVEMLVHVSADRSNATVMSIPRDLMTQLPACTDPVTKTHTDGGLGQINSALQYGPGCSVAAIHQLTGVPIDHFAMVDFSGVVSMSDAVGGVNVCVNNNVYDPYSHLKLAKGTHTLKGMAALEFVRTRHGFGDGSDLGRTYAQHTFLTQMMNKLKNAGTLTNPVAVLGLAQAATKALTVDTGLAGIPQLLGLADDLHKVPTSRMTFTTMQNYPDPNNSSRVLLGPGAQTLFTTIINDQSLTTDSGAKTAAGASASASAAAKPAAPTTAAAKTVPNGDLAVRVENGSGRTGRATTVRDGLVAQGYSSNSTTANAPSSSSTSALYYGAGHEDNAKQVAASLGLPASAIKQGTSSRLVLVIGSDWTSGTTFSATSGGASSPAPVNTSVALNNSHAQTGDQTNTCVPVSTQYTVQLNGVGMTPIQAFSRSPDVPVSAP